LAKDRRTKSPFKQELSSTKSGMTHSYASGTTYKTKKAASTVRCDILKVDSESPKQETKRYVYVSLVF
jgi:hypothetical protein